MTTEQEHYEEQYRRDQLEYEAEIEALEWQMQCEEQAEQDRRNAERWATSD